MARAAPRRRGDPKRRRNSVFDDVGLPAEGAAHLIVRADLLIRLQSAIKARHLTQTRAANVLAVSQPRVSDLLRGRIDLFSTDALIELLARLGLDA